MKYSSGIDKRIGRSQCNNLSRNYKYVQKKYVLTVGTTFNCVPKNLILVYVL